MILQLRIENFQAFQRLVLPIASGLTAIVGPNDCGKSSIVRALRWLYRDAFRGTFFMRTGTSQCAVGALIDDGLVIRRVSRTEAGSLRDNTYSVKGSGGAVQEFSKFRTIPGEVLGALAMSPPLQIGKDLEIDLNFSTQHGDNLFVLSRPGSVPARLLSYIVNLDPVIDAMRDASASRLSTNRELERLDVERTGLVQECKDFPVDRYVRTFDELDALMREAEMTAQYITKVEGLADDIASIIQSASKGAAYVAVCRGVLKLPFEEAINLCDFIIAVESLQIDVITDQVSCAANVSVRWSGVSGLVNSASYDIDHAQTLLGAVNEFYKVEKDVALMTADYAKVQSAHDTAAGVLSDFMSNLEVCPLCERLL